MHDKAVKALPDFLASKGQKASRDKAQLCCPGVQYLGQWVTQGSREILPAKSFAINAMSLPTIVHKLQAFLGLCNYCRHWIDSYVAISQPLYDLFKVCESSTGYLADTVSICTMYARTNSHSHMSSFCVSTAQ